MASNDLSKENVKDLVYAYEDHGVTDELYSFGVLLLNEVGQRASQIDAKAATTLGWATAILAFLFGTLKQPDRLSLVVALISGLCALTAIILSFVALRIRDEWKWPSDKDWFETTALTSADELKRFHVRSIHEVRQTHKRIAERKGDYLFWGQKMLVLGAVLLALGIVLKLLLFVSPTIVIFLQRIGMGIGVS